MIAIVRISGQQFKVSSGDKIYVPHLKSSEGVSLTDGDSVTFEDVLMTEEEGVISLDKNAGKKVHANILSNTVKGDKVIAFKMKRRKGFRKKLGHRTHYTYLEIESIQ